MVNATHATFDTLLLSWYTKPASAFGADMAPINVSCATPPRLDPTPLGLEVSLNAQQCGHVSKRSRRWPLQASSRLTTPHQASTRLNMPQHAYKPHLSQPP